MLYPPPDGKSYQQLVTDGDGAVGWVDRLAYDSVSRNVEFSDTLTVKNHIVSNSDYIKGYNNKNLYILLDGVEYPFEANGTVAVYGDRIFGNPALLEDYCATNFGSSVSGGDNGLPFAYIEAFGAPSNTWAFALDNGTVNVEVFEKVEQTKTIDPKYLPEGLGGEFVVTVSVDLSDNVQAKDKTFAEIKSAWESGQSVCFQLKRLRSNGTVCMDMKSRSIVCVTSDDDDDEPDYFGAAFFQATSNNTFDVNVYKIAIDEEDNVLCGFVGTIAVAEGG